MSVDFFRCDLIEAPVPAPSLPRDAKFRLWRPDVEGFPPPGSRRPSNLFWWAMAKAGKFARAGFAEVAIEQRGRLVHRLIVTPAWYRFPFMGAHDLQIGDVWTSPRARRQQLARTAVAEVHRRFGLEKSRIWYVTDCDNLASQALAKSCGYRLVGRGRKTRRFGTAFLGQYVIERVF